jgi:hypothetical protein
LLLVVAGREKNFYELSRSFERIDVLLITTTTTTTNTIIVIVIIIITSNEDVAGDKVLAPK